MEITVSKILLEDVLTRLKSVSKGKSISAASNSVQMLISQEQLMFTSRGNDMFARINIVKGDFSLSQNLKETLETKKELEVCIPDDLISLFPKLPGYMNSLIRLQIESSGDDEKYKISLLPPVSENKKSHYRVLGLKNSGGYFRIPDLCFDNFITIKAHDVKRIIDKVTIASADAQYKMFYMGINFVVKDDKVTATCTNGQKAAELTVNNIENKFNSKDEEVKFLFYAKSLSKAANILEMAKESDDVKIAYNNNAVGLSQGDKSVYISRIVGENFPSLSNSERIPSNFKTSLKINISEFKSLLAPMKVLAQTTINLSFKKDKVILNLDSGKGDAQEEIGIEEWVEGEEVEKIKFSIHYLTELLDGFDEDVVLFQVNAANTPIKMIEKDYVQLLGVYAV
ncbi:MAG: hypothetical protein WDK95_16485 [Syntrophorhabdaceae bacterium]